MSKQATALRTAYPADWQIKPLADLLIAGPQNGYSGKCGKDARGTPTLVLTATTSGRLVLTDDTIKRLNETIAKESDLFLRQGDVLVQRSNTAELVGTTAVFDGPPGVYVYPDLMIRLRFRDNITGQWFWRYSNSATGRRYYTAVAAGSTGTMPKVSGEALRLMPVPLPPIEEQQAIAQALSDVDDLIHSLERLIAKKRDLKQAAMQQLLTGQTRLPGFSGEWGKVKISDVAETDPASLGSGTPPEFRFNYISLENVDRGRLTGFSETTFAAAPSRARRCLQINDVLVSTVRPNLQSHLHFQERGEWVCSTGFCVVRSRPGTTDSLFVFFSLFSDAVSRQIDALLTGSNYPAINSSDVRGLVLEVPPFQEQAAIAEVLSDMDAEITALEARLAKTRDLKQGMMQELLTGRTRLV